MMSGGLWAVMALNRTKIYLFLSLAAIWTIASIMPRYKTTVQTQLTSIIAAGREHIPALTIDFHPERDPRTAYNHTKLAMLIEGRPIPHLVPQILHMMTVVPPDWRFLFIGSNESVFSVGRSFGIKTYQASGKLDIMRAPRPWTIGSKEDISRMMTDLRFYDEIIPGVEYLLKYESDAILCSNSPDGLNDWLEYDWAGAPKTPNDHFAGNGGLSLRRTSAIRQVLGFQVRPNNSAPEDEWFGKRISLMPNLKIAVGEDAKHFSVEDVYHEKPMGYHVRNVGEGKLPEGVWKDREQRKKIFDYCPEVAMVMDMKLERERCAGDNGQGKIDKAAELGHKKRRDVAAGSGSGSGSDGHSEAQVEIAEEAYVPAWRREVEYAYPIL